MRRICLIFFVLCTCFHMAGAQSAIDSTITVALDAKLEEYFTRLEHEPIETRIEECDFLVRSCTDSLIRQYVALRIYDHYLGSKLMGDESVAVHFVDYWFADGKVDMGDDIDLLNAKVYAQYNRSSLIGMQAPVVSLVDRDNNAVRIPGEGFFSVLFFYDTSCSKCKLESMKLKTFLSDFDSPVDVYAIYTGVVKEQWDDFVNSRWDFHPLSVRMHHLWDPESNSDFQEKYSVLQTPRMFLIDKDGVIVGRGLDTESLISLLDTFLPKPYQYGQENSMSFFKGLFDGNEKAEDYLEIASYLKEQSLVQADSLLCKHLMGDLFYYLLDGRDYEQKLALSTFIKIYIEGDSLLWSDKEDGPTVVGPSEIAAELIGRTPVGSRIPRIKLTGLDYRSQKKKSWNLRRMRSDESYLFFYNPSCSICESEIDGLPAFIESHPDALVLLVNPDDNDSEIFDVFDLSSIPYIISINGKSFVTGKYLSFLR